MKKNFKFYKFYYRYYKEMHEHYNDLFKSAVKELKFERIRQDSLRQWLEEVKTLLEDWVDNNIIVKVIKNLKERDLLDNIIHNNLYTKEKNNGGFTK